MSSKYDRDIETVKLNIVAAIINSQGKATSFEYKCGQYSRDYKLLFTKQPYGYVEIIDHCKAILSSLPFGVSGEKELVRFDIERREHQKPVEHGNVVINVRISEGYARKKYNEMKRKMSPMISGMKRNEEAINKIVEHIKGYGNRLRDFDACVFPGAVAVDEGDCAGGGIRFSDLGMKRLDSTESRLALATVIVESLNLEEKKYKYFASSRGTIIVIYIRLIQKENPDSKLKSWY